MKADVEIESKRFPMQFSKNLEIIKLIISIVKVKLTGSSGYDEAEMYCRDAKIPCVTIGPGLDAQAHVADEYIPIKNLQRATSLYEKLIRKVCL